MLDFSRLHVLLIGVSNFPDDEQLHDIPNVDVNLNRLKRVLLDKRVVGVPRENLTVSRNQKLTQILRQIRDKTAAAQSQKDSLLIYYSGHGIYSGETFEMHLATVESSHEYLDVTSLEIKRFKSLVLNSRAGNTFIIIDACNSGDLHNIMGAAEDAYNAPFKEFKQQNEDEDSRGIFMLSSSDTDEHSLYPTDQPDMPTYFTGKLIEILEKGIDNYSEYITFRDIYDTIRSDFKKKPTTGIRLPLPRKTATDDAERFAIAQNQKYSPEKHRWIKAKERNSIKSYQNFLKEHPNSQFARLAKDKIAKLSELKGWERAIKTDTAAAYERFLIRFPDSEKKDIVGALIKERQESEYWQDVKNNMNIDLINIYLEKYPEGKYVLQAENLLAEIQDNNHWKRACSQNTITAYKSYIQHQKSGKHIEAADEQIKLLKAKKNFWQMPSSEPKSTTPTNKKKSPFKKFKQLDHHVKSILITALIISTIITAFWLFNYHNNSQSYKKKKIEASIKQAHKYMAAKDWENAEKALENAIEIGDNQQSTLDSLRKCKVSIRPIPSMIEAYKEEAELHIKKGAFKSARCKIKAIYNVAPNSPIITELEKKLEHKTNVRIGELIKKADKLAMHKETYADALSIYRDARDYGQQTKLIDERIRKLQSKIDKVYKQAIEAYKEFSSVEVGYQDADSALDIALMVKPNDSLALKYQRVLKIKMEQ